MKDTVNSDLVLKFTPKEEAEIRAALVQFIQRVGAGKATTPEVSVMPYTLSVMFPNCGKSVTLSTKTNSDN